MPDTPRFGVRFKRRRGVRQLVAGVTPKRAENRREPRGEIERHDRVPVYGRAVELAARAHAVIELAETERFFLRDQLDRKSSLVPQLIAQGLAIADMPARRELFRQARRALTDCAAIFDMLLQRGSAPDEAVAGARVLALALLEELFALTVEPGKVW
ncbi:MAG TPA: four helix bundle protein [Kofleriaceae bacterium]|nr:four helix bundle protein [Kofleriaceae bacterium]